MTTSIKTLLMSLLLLLSSYAKLKACTPLQTPVLTQTAIVGNDLLLNMNSVSVWMCPGYNVQLELICAGQNFTGNPPYYYTSPAFTKTAAVQPLPQMTVSLAGLCPGGVYQFRWRETYQGFSPSPWSAAVSFTMPGVLSQPTLVVTGTPTQICYPQTSQLTATVNGGCGGGAGAQYIWTPAVGLSCTNCPNPIASPTITQTYTVVASGTNPASCWTASNTITIVSFTVPGTVGTASSIPMLCAGQSNQISISSSSGLLQWEESVNGAPYVNVAGATGTTMITPTLSPGMYCYRLKAIGCGGTVTSAAVCTSVTATPTISVGSPSMCVGQTLTLNGNGAQLFTWPAGIGSTGPTTGTTSPLQTTAYTATGTTNGCSSTFDFTVLVTAYPIVNLTSNSPVCINSPININNTGIGNYVWTGPSGYTTNVQNPVIAAAQPSNDGIYNVSVTVNGCTTTNSINVSVWNPTVSAANGGTFCAGTNVVLSCSSSSVTGYSWTGPNNFISVAQNPTITNAPVAATGIYTVVVNQGVCVASATTALFINPQPVPTLTTNAPICEGTSLSIGASGANAYYITGPLSYTSNSPANVISPASWMASGVYSVSATDLNGCVAGATVFALVNQLPPLKVEGDEACISGTAALTATGGVTYSWVGPNGFTANSQNLFFPNLLPTQTGTYICTATGANGCTISAGVTLTNSPIPTPTVSAPLNACIGSQVTFTGQGGYLYNWYGPNGFVSHDSIAKTPVFNSLNYTGTYTLGVINLMGCMGYTTFGFTVNPLPTATIVADLNGKCAPYCATYSLSSSQQLQNVSWNMNNTGSSMTNPYTYCFNTDGNRVLRSVFMDNYGCVNATSYSINVYPKPMADFHATPGDAVENDMIEFADASLGPNINKWNWYFADNANNATYQNPTFIFEKAGSYPVTLIITNKWGCMDTITKAVNIGNDANLFIPNTFSPNGDGVNDTFQPKGFGITQYKLEVFDQWGTRVYFTEDFNSGWDGTFKGKLLKNDVFVYKIVASDVRGKTKEYTGHVSIMK